MNIRNHTIRRSKERERKDSRIFYARMRRGGLKGLKIAKNDNHGYQIGLGKFRIMAKKYSLLLKFYFFLSAFAYNRPNILTAIREAISVYYYWNIKNMYVWVRTLKNYRGQLLKDLHLCQAYFFWRKANKMRYHFQIGGCYLYDPGSNRSQNKQ